MTTKLIRHALVFLAAFAWAQVAEAFTVQVMMGSEAQSPSLVFGEAEEAVSMPFPPFSAMFGMKDVYLANPANLGGADAVSGDLARLGTDLRTAAEGNAWVLVASTDAHLTFQAAPDSSPGPALYLSNDGEEAEAVELTLPASLSVKAGVNYTIRKTREGGAITPAQDPANVVVFLDRQEGEEVFSGEEKEFACPSQKVSMRLVNGSDTPIAVKDAFGTYHREDGTSSGERPAEGWVILLGGSATAVSYANGEATIDLAEGGSLALSAIALKGGYKPISASLFQELGQRIASCHWVILPSGTLDYDGNGEVDMDDAMYVYNLVGAGCPTPEDDWFVAADLQPFTTNATSELLQAALETLQGLPSQLDFDGNGEVDMDDAMYLYNFVGAGCPTPEDDWFAAADLQPFTTNASQERLQAALETLQSLGSQK